MNQISTRIVLGGITIAQCWYAIALPKPQNDGKSPITKTITHPESALPPLPPGKTTVIGGAIRDVDPVRDQLKLQVFGARPIRVLYDERTHVYRDGKRIPVRDLRSEAHASVQTVLDGTDIYAVSIHILSQSPEGETQGQVVSYDPGTGELLVSTALSREPIRLRVPAGTSIVTRGKAPSATNSASSGTASLVNGALVSVQFASGNDGRGVASRIVVLATPGSTAVFRGNLTFIDLHAKMLAVEDPREDKNYTISFDPARFPVAKDLHVGTGVRIRATFDGAGYAADSIQIER